MDSQHLHSDHVSVPSSQILEDHFSNLPEDLSVYLSNDVVDDPIPHPEPLWNSCFMNSKKQIFKLDAMQNSCFRDEIYKYRYLSQKNVSSSWIVCLRDRCLIFLPF